MPAEVVDVSWVCCGGTASHGAIAVKIIRKTHAMAPVFWLRMARGALQLPSLSPFTLYTGTLEMESGTFSVCLVRITDMVRPSGISLSAISAALRYKFWCVAPLCCVVVHVC